MLPFETVELELLMLLILLWWLLLLAAAATAATLLLLRLVRGAADGPIGGAPLALPAAAAALAAAGDAEAPGTGGTGGTGCWWRPDGAVDGAAPGGMCFNI